MFFVFRRQTHFSGLYLIQSEKPRFGRIDPELQGLYDRTMQCVPSQHARRRTLVRFAATLVYRIALQPRFRNHERRHPRPRPEGRAAQTDRRKSLPRTIRLLRQQDFRNVRVTVTARNRPHHSYPIQKDDLRVVFFRLFEIPEVLPGCGVRPTFNYKIFER